MKQAIRKLLDILPPKDRLKAVILLVLMFIGTGIDVIGIGMIPLYISVIANPGILLGHSMGGPLLEQVGLTEPRDLLIYGGVALLFIFLLRGGYIIWLQYVQARFVNGRYVTISSALFRRYMLADYPFHLQRNSAVLIRNVSNETRLITNQVIMPTLNILMQTTTAAGIFLMLLWVEPLITLITIGVIGLGGTLLLHLLKERMKRYGKIAAAERANIIQAVNEAIGGFKSVAVSFRQGFFMKRFDANLSRIREADTVRMVTEKAVRPSTELIAVVGMMAIAFFMVAQNREMDLILPVLSLFAAATIRLMPAIAETIRSLTSLRFYISSLTPVHHDLYGGGVPLAEKFVEDSVDKSEERNLRAGGANAEQSAGAEQSTDASIETGRAREVSTVDDASPSTRNKFREAIQLKDVSYRYPGSDEQAVDRINLTIRKGEVVGFVGSSGAGKSTLVDLILGLLRPTEGEILIDGRPLQAQRRDWMTNIGYIPQFIYLADDTIDHNIAFGIPQEEIDQVKLNQAVADAQLGELMESLSEGGKTMIGESGVRLSGGQRQRIGIARALYDQPDVLMMDEATAALDNITERQVISAIELLRGSRTIMMVAHRLSTVRNCDRLYLLEGGRIVAEGTCEELQRKSELFRSMSEG